MAATNYEGCAGMQSFVASITDDPTIKSKLQGQANFLYTKAGEQRGSVYTAREIAAHKAKLMDVMLQNPSNETASKFAEISASCSTVAWNAGYYR